MTFSKSLFGCAAGLIAFLLLGVALPAQANAAHDLSTMLRLMPADGATMLVVDDLAAIEAALTAWRPLLGATGFGADSFAALRKLLPFAEWVNVSAPLAFRPPAAGTADKAVYWLHIPQFKEKIAALPTATEDDGMWRATDKAGVTWFAKASGDIVVISASRIHVEAAIAPARTLAEEYAPHQEVLAARNMLLHMKSAAYAVQLSAALEALSNRLSTPAADGRSNPLAAFTAQIVRELRSLTAQTRTAGLLLQVDAEKLAASFVFSFQDGTAQEYLKNVREGAGCVTQMALSGDVVLAAAWCEPAADAPFLGPWLNRRIDALDAPLKNVLANLRTGVLTLAPDDTYFRTLITLSSDESASARENIQRADPSSDAVRRMLNAFRGPTPDAAADPWYDAVAPLIDPEALLAISSGSEKQITLNLGTPRKDAAAAEQRPEEIPRLRSALGQFDRQAQFILLADLAGLLPALAKFGLTAPPLNNPIPGLLAGLGVTAKPAGLRIDVHIPKASLERVQEATTPSGPT